MAKNDVIVRMTAEDASVVAAWQRAKQGPEKMTQELDKVGKAGGRAGKATQSAFGQLGGQLLQMGVAITGIGSAAAGAMKLVDILKTELERVRAMRGEFADQQMDTGKAFMQMANALEQKGIKVDLAAARKQIQGNTYGVNESELYRVSEKALSSAGDVPQEKVLETVSESARLFPYMNEQDRTALVVASNNIQKTFGTKPSEAMAQVVQSAAAAPGAELADFATYYGGGVSKLAAVGSGKDSYQDLMAIMSGIGHRSQDMTGRTTATNTQNALMQLKEEGVKAGLFGKDESVVNMLGAIQGNDPKAHALRTKLLGVFSDAPTQLLEAQKSGNADLASEAKTKIALQELLSGGDNQTKKEIRAARGKLGTFQEAEASSNRLREQLAGDPGQAAYEAALQRNKMEQELRSAPGPAAAAGHVRDFQSLMGATGETATRAKMGGMVRDLTAAEDPVGATEQSIRDIEMRQEELRNPRQRTKVGQITRDLGAYGFGFAPQYLDKSADVAPVPGFRRTQSADDQKMIETLEETKNAMKAQVEIMKKVEANTSKTETNTKPKPGPAPVAPIMHPVDRYSH